MWKVTERDIDQIQIVLGMSLQEAMENYLGVTLIRFVSSTLQMLEAFVSRYGAESKQGGTAYDTSHAFW